MLSYIRCCKCGHQWKVIGNVNQVKCEKCGGTRIDLNMGSMTAKPPTWWKAS